MFKFLSNRRNFLKSGIALGGAIVLPHTSSFTTMRHLSSKSKFKISCAAYSYRKYLQNGEMDLFDFIDRCVDMDIDNSHRLYPILS